MGSKSPKRPSAVKEYVTVAFAEDMDLARQYEALLAEHQIPAVVKKQPQPAEGDFSGIAVMVPEEYLDAAYDLISEEASYDDFFEAAFSDHDHEERDTTFFGEQDDEVF